VRTGIVNVVELKVNHYRLYNLEGAGSFGAPALS
jgi:hypothetical protein